MQSRNKQIWLTHSWISDEFSLLIHSKSKLSTAALLSDIFYLTFLYFSRFTFVKLVNLLNFVAEAVVGRLMSFSIAEETTLTVIIAH